MADSTTPYPRTPPAIIFAFGSVTIACIIAFGAIGPHLMNYKKPEIQRYIVRILLIIPIYSLGSFMSLVFPHVRIWLKTATDLWEAVIIYCFMVLILQYCGGESACVTAIARHPASIPHAFPLNFCLPRIPTTGSFLKSCKRWTIQFVVVKPIMAVLTLLVALFGHSDNVPWKVLQGVIYNISYGAALYALMLFYMATREHEGLADKNPLLKFAAVKSIVFATFWQEFFISIFPETHIEHPHAWTDFILCVEMSLFAILQHLAFHYSPKEFDRPSYGEEPGGVPQRASESAGRGHQGARAEGRLAEGAVADIGKMEEGEKDKKHQREGGGQGGSREPPEFSVLGLPRDPAERKKMLSNMRDAVNMQDVVSDAYYNFNKKYTGHVKLQEEADGPNGPNSPGTSSPGSGTVSHRHTPRGSTAALATVRAKMSSSKDGIPPPPPPVSASAEANGSPHPRLSPSQTGAMPRQSSNSNSIQGSGYPPRSSCSSSPTGDQGTPLPSVGGAVAAMGIGVASSHRGVSSRSPPGGVGVHGELQDEFEEEDLDDDDILIRAAIQKTEQERRGSIGSNGAAPTTTIHIVPDLPSVPHAQTSGHPPPQQPYMRTGAAGGKEIGEPFPGGVQVFGRSGAAAAASSGTHTGPHTAAAYDDAEGDGDFPSVPPSMAVASETLMYEAPSTPSSVGGNGGGTQTTGQPTKESGSHFTGTHLY